MDKSYNEDLYIRIVNQLGLTNFIEQLNDRDDTIITDIMSNLPMIIIIKILLARCHYTQKEMVIINHENLMSDDNFYYSNDIIELLQKQKKFTIIVMSNSFENLHLFDNIIFVHNFQVEYFGPYYGILNNNSFLVLKRDHLKKSNIKKQYLNIQESYQAKLSDNFDLPFSTHDNKI